MIERRSPRHPTKCWNKLTGIYVGAAWLIVACAVDRNDPGTRQELPGANGGAGVTSGPTTGPQSSGGAGAQDAAGGAGGTVSTTMSSSSANGSGGSGGGGGAAASSSASGTTCEDTAEPNESETSAHDLGMIDDCDKNGGTLSGALDGPNDVDWFTYQATDAFGCQVNPHRKVNPPSGVRLCKFAACFIGTTKISCQNNATPATSPDGRSGCCHNLSFGMDVDCEGINDDANVYIRLDQGPNTCTKYTVDYHY